MIAFVLLVGLVFVSLLVVRAVARARRANGQPDPVTGLFPRRVGDIRRINSRGGM